VNNKGKQALQMLQEQRWSRRQQIQQRDTLERHRDAEFDAADIGALFYENTKIDLVRYQFFEEKSAAVDAAVDHVDPDYPTAETVPLPEGVELSVDLGEALARRRSVRSFADEPLTRRELGGLLEHGAGVSDEESEKRTYASPGALYPTELYLLVRNVEGVDPGVYYYNAPRHVLRRLEAGGPAFDDRVASTIIGNSAADVTTAGVVFVFTATFPRVTFKYGARGYRYALQESGHLSQNLLLAATGLGLAAIPQAAFRDEATNELLGVDGVSEAATYTTVVGRPEANG
jgi:SagB-type dehydrogenase family enzyme